MNVVRCLVALQHPIIVKFLSLQVLLLTEPSPLVKCPSFNMLNAGCGKEAAVLLQSNKQHPKTTEKQSQTQKTGSSRTKTLQKFNQIKTYCED